MAFFGTSNSFLSFSLAPTPAWKPNRQRTNPVTARPNKRGNMAWPPRNEVVSYPGDTCVLSGAASNGVIGGHRRRNSNAKYTMQLGVTNSHGVGLARRA